MTHDDRSYSALGSILLSMNALSEQTLLTVLEEQGGLQEVFLGELLITKGLITRDQLNNALAQQNKIRGKNKVKQSMAMADLAIKRHRRSSVVARRERVVKKGEEAAKRLTSGEHPVVSNKHNAKK